MYMKNQDYDSSRRKIDTRKEVAGEQRLIHPHPEGRNRT
jgi:hypothetical protein